jgi:hypothetical protein
MMNRVDFAHAGPTAQALVLRALRVAFGVDRAAIGAVGAFHVVPEPTLQLGGDAVRPSLAAWPRDISIQPRAGEPIHKVPVWVCEITSRRDARDTRVTRQTIYRREKVEFVWQLDVDLHTLETFRLLDDKLTEFDAFSDDDRVRTAPFEDTELDLAALWAELEK